VKLPTNVGSFRGLRISNWDTGNEILAVAYFRGKRHHPFKTKPIKTEPSLSVMTNLLFPPGEAGRNTLFLIPACLSAQFNMTRSELK
jgi:hypothetical protein